MPSSARDQPAAVETLSSLQVDQLPSADAATWLDQELSAPAPTVVRDSGFGREVRNALSAWRQWLVEQQLAHPVGDQVPLRTDALLLLQRLELMCAGEQLSTELAKPFVKAKAGNPIEGRLARKVELLSGWFTLIKRSREFTLVPWRDVLGQQLVNPLPASCARRALIGSLAGVAPDRKSRDAAGARMPGRAIEAQLPN